MTEKPSRREIQRAMLSLYSHSLQGARPGALRLLHLAPVDQAVDVLLQCGDDHRWQRAHLAALQAKRGRASRSLQSGSRRLEAALADLAAAGAAPECRIQVEQIDPDFDLETNAVTFRTTSRVNRPLSKLRRLLDPRAWGKCSDFFDPEKTYRILVDGDRPVRDRKGSYVRWDGPEPLGDSWQGLLRERFDGPGVAVDNILAIDFVASDAEVLVDYALYVSERCSLGPFTDVGGLHKNGGGAKAWIDEDTGESVVEVTKTLRFHDFTPGDPGEWVDFGDALSMLLAVVGIALVADKAVLRLCCDPDIELTPPQPS